MAISRTPLLIGALLLIATPSWADAVIRGVIWSSRAEARRAEKARAEIAAEKAAPRNENYLLPARMTTPPPPPGKLTPMPVLRPQEGMRETIVYLDSIPANTDRKLADHERKLRKNVPYRIVMADSRYDPRVASVAAGTWVEIQNSDFIWHNTFSVSRAKSFDLGKIRPGTTDSVFFDRAGLVNLLCDIHPKETCFLLVTPNHAADRPDSLGQFELPKVPRGRYRLRFWNPDLGEDSREVEVPNRGVLYVDLAFP